MEHYGIIHGKWTTKISIMLGRILGLLLLCLLWIIDDHSRPEGVVLLLFIIIITLCRWRFQLPGWTILIDEIACLIAVPFWSNGIFGMIIPIFEGMLFGKLVYILPGAFFAFIYQQISFPFVVAYIISGFIGWIIRSWSLETKRYQDEIDQQRRIRYELEDIETELLSANIQISKMTEISERNRITQELHDSVGHELTAAVLALQAFEQLWKEEHPMAEEMFLKAKERLLSSAQQLRETVHNIKPVSTIGIDRLKEISKEFFAFPIDFKIYGDTSRIPIYLLSILEPCLKEALTNIARHAKANKVEITLDANPSIVRLSVFNDGVIGEKYGIGMGIRNLRQRAKSVGGSISIDTTDGYRLICVLPMQDIH